MGKSTNLTRKQQNFVASLLKDSKKSATQAAIEAYNAKSRHVARQIARENLQKPAIIEYLGRFDNKAQKTLVEVMQYAQRQKTPAYQRLAKDCAIEILDRIHGKATAKVETKNLNLNIEPNQELAKDFTDYLKLKTIE